MIDSVTNLLISPIPWWVIAIDIPIVLMMCFGLFNMPKAPWYDVLYDPDAEAREWNEEE